MIKLLMLIAFAAALMVSPAVAKPQVLLGSYGYSYPAYAYSPLEYTYSYPYAYTYGYPLAYY